MSPRDATSPIARLRKLSNLAGRLLLWCRAGAPSASSHGSGLVLLEMFVHCTFLPELITLLANVESDRSQLLAVSCCGVSCCG